MMHQGSTIFFFTPRNATLYYPWHHIVDPSREDRHHSGSTYEPNCATSASGERFPWFLSNDEEREREE